MLPDIATRDDCERLVRAFYERAFEDDRLGPIFRDVAQLDLERHVPRITSFWASVLLGERSYPGGAFVPHYQLDQLTPLTAELFAHWVALWTATVTQHFDGPVADDAIRRANLVAGAFSKRLEDLRAASSGRPLL